MKWLDTEQLTLMRKVLTDLKPYVMVIGSVARGDDDELRYLKSMDVTGVV